MQSANGYQNSVELFFLGKLPGSSQGWVWLIGCILAMGYKQKRCHYFQPWAAICFYVWSLFFFPVQHLDEDWNGVDPQNARGMGLQMIMWNSSFENTDTHRCTHMNTHVAANPTTQVLYFCFLSLKHVGCFSRGPYCYVQMLAFFFSECRGKIFFPSL